MDEEDLLVHLGSSGSLLFEYTELEDWYEARKKKKEPTVSLKVSQDIFYNNFLSLSKLSDISGRTHEGGQNQ